MDNGKQYITYHCATPKLINYSKIDTSICAVFYIRDSTELTTSFIPRLKAYAEKEHSLLQMPEKSPVMVEFDDNEDCDIGEEDDDNDQAEGN